MRRLASLFACAVLFVAGRSSAGPGDDERADRLFQEARTLISDGNYGDACPKLEEAQKASPSLGVEHTLADCYEHIDKKALAWDTFMDVAGRAKLAGKADQETSARSRAAALEGAIARLTISLAASASRLEVTIDDRRVPADKLGTPVAIDAGHHRIVASAPGRIPFSHELDAEAGREVTVTIPLLEGTGDKRDSPFQPQKVVVAEDQRGNTQRKIGLAVATLGVLGLAGGGILGLLSLSKNDLAALSACPDPTAPCGDAPSRQIWKDAVDLGNASTLVFSIGTLVLAGGVVMYFLAPGAGK